MIADSVLVNAKAYFKREIVDCSIAINEGKILKIGREVNMPKADVRTDLKTRLVLPGLIDVHVHLRDEGKSRKEDFYTGTAAAAAGGFTTVIDMPNNEPVTMSPRTLHDRIEIAEKRILVNVGFRSEFATNLEDIRPVVNQGALGFKLFMAEQVGGLDLDSDEAITGAFKKVAKLGVSVAVHAEDKDTLKHLEDTLKNQGRKDIAAYLRAHSETVELQAIGHILKIMKNSKAQLHVCHITTKQAVEAISEAKKSGLNVSCEATPHNLLLSTEDLKKIGPLCLTMPPVRDKPNIEALWDAVQNGSIDIIASDHAPHLLKEKEAESVWDIKVGVPGLETTLPLMLTEVNRGRLAISDVVRLAAEKPAELFKLKGKGILKEGNDADLTVVDLYKRHKIDASLFQSKAKYSPFDGREVQGKSILTFVNGQLVMEEGEITAKPGSGTIVRRETSA